MTKKLLLALSAAALGLSAAHAGAQTESRAEQKQACFDKHASLMSKPAVKNLQDCWRTHSYL